MITLSADPQMARTEAALRQWFTDELGAEDADHIVRHFWSHHRLDFVDVMVAVRWQTIERGPQFLRNILAHTRKPKAQLEAEHEIVGWVQPRLQRAAETIQRHPAAEGEVTAGLVAEIADFALRTWPDRHLATVRGAVVAALVYRDGDYELRVDALVSALSQPDPLAANAKASRL